MAKTDLHHINTDRYSVMCISEQNFAVEIEYMREVIPLPKIAPVPNVDDSIYGIFNLRGNIYPVFDLRKLFRLVENEITDKNFVVLLEIDQLIFGVLVDRVLDVTLIENDKIQVPTREMSPQYVQYLSGYYQHKKMGMVYLMDLSQILQSKELIRYRYA